MQDIMFVDIETGSEYRHYASDVPERLREIFEKKFAHHIPDKAPSFSQLYNNIAAMHAEFGKIISITMGSMVKDKFCIRTHIGRDEKQLLTAFNASMIKSGSTKMCAHNGIEFDYPFIVRRCIINEIPVHTMLDPFNKKPWQVSDNLYDTVKIWSGVQYNYKASLDLLAYCLGLPSPKQLMDGSMVSPLYHSMFDSKEELPFDAEQRVFTKIGEYNRIDVITLAKVFCRLTGQTVITDDQIVIL